MKERSTLQPFAPGDVFVGSTVLDGGDDDHAGRGRILQYDSQLRKKGVLWLSQTTHLVGGLRFDREGRLWAFDSQAFVVLTITREGQVQKRDFGTRPFSNVNFCSDGSLYLAEAVTGNGIKMEILARMGTRLQRMPGTDRFGDGHVWHYRADGTLLRELATQVHGGIGGFMGVTMSALSPDESTLVYCSETGTRLMRYDLESARQLPDLQCLPEGEREMFFAMDYGPRGRLYVSRGTRVDLVSPEGRTMCCYPLDGHGWATLKAAADGRHLYVGNYFSGQLVKLELESGEHVAVADTGVERSLAGIAEYAGDAACGAPAGDSSQRRKKHKERKKAAPLSKLPRRNQQRTASGARSAGRRKLRQRPSRPRKK
jgi:sugar lactone lactonase YvrE